MMPGTRDPKPLSTPAVISWVMFARGSTAQEQVGCTGVPVTEILLADAGVAEVVFIVDSVSFVQVEWFVVRVALE